MALDFQTIQTPFRFGLAEGVDPRQTPAGTLVTAENVVWKQSGRIEKRPGTTALSVTTTSAGALPSGSRMFTRGSELCVTDGTYLYGYAPQIAKWKNTGRIPNYGLTWSTAIDPTSEIQSYDSAVSSTGLRVDVWHSGSATAGDIFAQVVDITSGTVVYPPTRIRNGNSRRVRVLIIGVTAIILTGDSSATAIVAYKLDLGTFSLTGPATLRSDVKQNIGVNYGFDACVIGSNFVLAYTNTAPVLKLYSYNSSLVQQASGSLASEVTGAYMVSVDGASGETLYVAYSRLGTTAARIGFANADTLVESGTNVVVETPYDIFTIGVCRLDSGNCVVAYTASHSATGGLRLTTYKVSSGGSVTAASERGTFGASLACKPFVQNFRCMVLATDTPLVGSGNTVTTNTCLLEVETTTNTSSFTPHRLHGTIDAIIGGEPVISKDSPLPTASAYSTTLTYVPITFQSTLRTSSGLTARHGLRSVAVSSTTSLPSDMWRGVYYGAEGFISGGVLTANDGRALFDYGFQRAPTFVSLSVTNGGFSMAAGNYLYGSVYEFRSATGMLYRSPALSSGTATTSGGASKVDVTVWGHGTGNKQTTATLFGTNTATPTVQALYRSVVNGTVLQRVTNEPSSTTTTYLDQTVETNTFMDSLADATYGLASRPAIYTTGGILDDYAPPSTVTMFRHADRLFVLSGDQKTWWYSKAFQDDIGTAPGFHPNFRVVFDERQVAGISMDDKAIFFSSTGISYMLGLGPAPNGLNSDFTTPTKIQTDVGCSNPRSVVSTPDGIMFLGDNGLYLLTRGLEVVWIGRPVRETLASFPAVTSAVLVPKHNQVRFTCNNSSTSPTSGTVIVYDYVEKQWSTFRHTATGYSYGCPYADACLYGGEWTYLTPSGLVYQDTSSSWLDGSAYVPMTIVTAWMSATGPMGFASVRTFGLHGTSQTNHDLSIYIGFDNSSSYDQTTSFAAQSAVTTIGDEDVNVTIGTRRKCNTIRFKVVDATPTTGDVGTGRGPTWDMMAIEVGVKRGMGNSPATKRA